MREKDEQNRKILHRENAEWLTVEICDEYRHRAIPVIKETGEQSGKFRELQRELADRCDITSLMAMNILRGYHARDYVACEEYKKKRMEESVQESIKRVEREAYDEWKRQREDMDEQINQIADDWKIED